MILLLLLSGAGLAAAALLAANSGRFDAAAAFAAKNACSAFFLAGRRPESVAGGENAFFPVKLARLSLDEGGRSATATILGLWSRTAAHRGGAGCALLPAGGTGAAAPIPQPVRRTSFPAGIYPFGRGEPETPPENGALADALATAFDADGRWKKKTAAAVVLRGGRLLAERYAPGFGPRTRLAGWSMTKSLTCAVAGALAREGRFDVSHKGVFPDWSGLRGEISLGNLLNMNSGLEWREDYSKLSDVAEMLYRGADTAAAQRGKPLETAPGTLWKYASGTTNLLSAHMRGLFTSYQAYLDYWYSAVFDRIGMRSLVLEADLAGNYVGSSFAWATARDWARFGLLFLRRGDWNGERVLDESWVDFVRAPAAGSGGQYGAHFWLNAAGKFPSAPRDMYYCGGFQGQYVFIIPSKDLVIVRLGLGEKPAFDADAFLAGVIAAAPPVSV